MTKPDQPPPPARAHEHRCVYEQDEVAHTYCRCLCGWWCGPEAHGVSDYFPSDKAGRTTWCPPEEDH